MKLHLLQKLFSLIACVYLASSGQCQEKAKEIPLTAQQKADLERALTLSKQANNLFSQGKYAEATPLAIETLKIYREVLGNKHPDTARSINNLALLYFNQAQYAKAEPLYLEALKIRRETLGNKHPDTATSINILALNYFKQAQYAKAEPLYLEALKIRREVLGDKHPDTANTINNLALLYSEQAQYAKAEPLYLEALKIYREVLGDKHPNTANTINNLALLYSKQAQYAKAEPLFVEGLKINREALGNNHPDTSRTINNLAALYSEQAQYAKAEPLFVEVLKINREALGNKHPGTATSINNLAALYSDQAQYAKAEPLSLEALKIKREVLGNNHLSTAASINNLAALYSKQAQYAKAEPLYLEALKIFREVSGNKHPDTATSINNLAILYFKQAQYAKAESLYLEALKISTAHLQATATIQSENAQILMTNDNKFFLNSFLNNALANHTPGGGYDHVLSWKGMIYRRQNLLRALQGNDPLKKELSDTIRQLATLLNSTPKPGEEQAFQDKVKTLSEKKEELEKELAKQIPTLNLSKVTSLDLQNLIAPDVTLVDIFQYNHSSKPKEGQGKLVFEQRYAAWVIKKDKPIVRLELGSAEDIDDLVFQWRSSLSTRKSPSESPQDPAMALREKVWLPIAKHLEGAKTVIISPDGLLGTLPFTALPGEDIKKYLIEERNIAVVPFLQTLPDLLAKKEGTDIASMLALGDVAYDIEAISPSSTSSLLAVRGEKGTKWNRLPGTKAEVLSIENSFRKYFPSGSLLELNQNKASEQSVRESAPKSKYLHFATHGFFADESIKAMSAKRDDNKRMMGEKAVVTGENPGLLSGLVLAGANLPPKGNGDDGILTASEVAELDLTGVELAILSACETGLGKTAGGEGIFGLQRAFQLSGARTVVASSWKVPDLSTKELMVRFYGNLWEKKMEKLEALREAQLWVMKEGKAAGLDRGIDDESVVVKETKKEPVKVESSTKGEMLPPKYWAAWILSGAWN
jgi:CHAT domain-containing protein